MSAGLYGVYLKSLVSTLGEGLTNNIPIKWLLENAEWLAMNMVDHVPHLYVRACGQQRQQTENVSTWQDEKTVH